jgi:hypothetical protein
MKRTVMLLWWAACGSCLSADAGAAEDLHMHHHDAPPAAAAVEPTATPPPLRILLPESGAKVGTQLAVVFETPGDLSRMTMSAPMMGTHLHIEVDDTSLMPTESQLIRLGGNRYVFVFDLPVKVGAHTVRVYWSDRMHHPIDSSRQSVNVLAEEAAKTP